MLTASTTTPDDFTGTSTADTFTASLGRLQSDDALNGAGGNDVLNARLGATVTPVIANIETLNIEATSAASLDGANITGATNVNVTGGNTLTYLKQDGEAFSVAGEGTGLTVSTALTDSSTNAITVTLGAGKLGSVTVGDKQTTDYEIVNLIVAGVGSATLVEADSGANTESFAETGDKIVVTGSGDYELAIAHALLGANATANSQTAATIDASGHTGKLTLDIGTDNTVDNISAEKWTGVDVIKIKTGSSDTDIITKVASGIEVVVNDQEAVDNTLTVAPNGSATTDALTITLNHKTAGSKIDLTGLVVDGFEDFTLNSTGTDSSSTVVANVIDDIAGTTSDTKLTIAGNKKLTATGIESTFTNITVTNTVGTDLTVDAGGALKFTGGSGSDRLELANIADITSADVLKGEGGTDTLALTDANLLETPAFSAAQIAAISGFEVLEFEGAQDLTAAGAGTDTIDMDAIGINVLKTTGAVTTDANDLLAIKAKDGFKWVMGGALAINTTYVDIQIVDAANAGTNNTVTVALERESAGAALSVDGWTIANVENQIIEVKGEMEANDIITIDQINGAQLSTITIKSTAGNNSTTGVAKVAETLAITAVQTTMATLLDATAMTGAVTFTDISAFSALGATLKGGSAVDTFTAGVGADVIEGNAGNDVLNGDEGNDNINGGAGDDNINGDVGADTLTGGTGKDVYVFDDNESTEAAMDQITDFSAAAADQSFDTLDLVGTTVTSITLANAISITGATTETETGALAAYAVNGIIKLSGTEAANVNTLSEWIDVAEILAAAQIVDDADTESSTLAFEFNGSTYVLQGDDGDAEATYATEMIVKLVGVTGITAISGTEAANTIDIA
jgi:hypothetical protein